MKKNKYRWREMKDDEPGFQEWILCLPSDWTIGTGIRPKSAQYFFPVEGYADCSYVNYSNDGAPIIVKNADIQWRKMCKLPGDK